MREFASGSWHVSKGNEEEFVQRWNEFLGWTRETQPGLIQAGLLRETGDDAHFISFAQWKDADARAAWKQSAGFGERFAACRALCDDFAGGDFERVAEF